MRYAVHLAVLAMSAAFACATPTEYRDGPMVRPEPARAVPGYTPPGTGLPEYMPMPESPQYPRSPHKRYLPPEKDGAPGIWAGDEPIVATPVSVKGMLIPLPDETPTPDIERARACAQGASATLDLPHSDLGSVLKGSPPPVADMRNCTLFLAWHRCMTSKMWPLTARPGNERLAAHAWEHFKKDPNRCHKWANARAESLALFEADLLSWFHGNYGSRQ